MNITNSQSTPMQNTISQEMGKRPPPPKDGQMPRGLENAISTLAESDQEAVKNMFLGMSETQHSEFKAMLDSLSEEQKTNLSGIDIKEALTVLTQNNVVNAENEIDLYV